MTAWGDWYVGKVFSSDWTSRNFDTWAEQLASFKDKEVAVLEIGSWEGRSAIFFLNFLRRCRLTCVEPFTGSVEHRDSEALSTLEDRFDKNLAPLSDRLEKIKSRSLPALDGFAQQGRTFDIIYVDGSHEADDVLLDSILCWKLLRDDGVMIWDDYLWGIPDLPENERPKRSIDAFLALQAGNYVLTHLAHQVIVRKRVSTTAVLEWIFPRTVANLGRFLRREPLRSPRARNIAKER